MSHDPARTRWALSAGWIPERSTGHEPEATSRNVLCLLNTTERDGCASIMIYHEDAEPVGPYEVPVRARRVRHIRINDLIDPEAVPLGVPYGIAVECDVPMVVQLALVDTSDGRYAVALLGGVAGD
ncbi:sensory rhodopsin transducer [Agrococcus sp. KRD186]|uniref:sensory rhodopsin transducer n=1 Tax=Agrococcus sp. KRD186 TaxID=2729730 RepID=UPI0019D2E137|nr:sensory rhodopsin transducer [Agrococcus sp. KRD186]